MKKSTPLLFLLAFLCLNVTAQKVKIKDLDVRAKYCDLPSIGMPIGATSYHVELGIDENAISSLKYSIADIKRSFYIEGYHKSDEAIGVKVLFETVDPPTGSSLKLNTDNKKDKAGKKWNEYYYTVTFSGKSMVKVIAENGSVVGENTQSYSEIKTTSKYLSTAQLKKQTNIEKLYFGGKSTAFGNLAERARLFVKNNFGLIAHDEKVEFKRLHSKKHPDYRKFLSCENIAKKAFEKMTIHSIDEYKSMIQPAIDFWIENEPNYSGSDKHQKKLKYACQYNAALAYFYAEDLDSASTWATLVQNGDYKEKNGKKLLKKIEELKTEFAKTRRNSRHIIIEVSKEDAAKKEAKIVERAKAVENGDIRSFPNFKSKLSVKSNSNIVEGTLHQKGGDTLNGYFVYENEYVGGPDFRQPKTIRFGYLENENVLVETLTYAKIKRMTINNVRYDVMDVSLVIKVKNAVVTVVEEYDRTQIIVVVPPFMKAKGLFGSESTDTEAELVVYNKEKDKILMTKSMLGGNGALKRIIKGCKEAEAHFEKRKKSSNTKSASSKLAGFDKAGLLQELLKIYDGCKK